MAIIYDSCASLTTIPSGGVKDARGGRKMCRISHLSAFSPGRPQKLPGARHSSHHHDLVFLTNETSPLKPIEMRHALACSGWPLECRHCASLLETVRICHSSRDSHQPRSVPDELSVRHARTLSQRTCGPSETILRLRYMHSALHSPYRLAHGVPDT